MKKSVALVVVVSFMVLAFGCTCNSMETPVFDYLVSSPPHRFSTAYKLPTFPDIAKTSVRIVIGQVVGIVGETSEEGRAVYSFRVNQCLDNEITGHTINIWPLHQLNIGDEYLIFCWRLHRSTLYPFDFYVVMLGAALVVDENGALWQLSDERSSFQAPPFVTDQYNEKEALLDYIASVRKAAPPQPEPVLESAPLEELVDLADFIVEIRPLYIERNPDNPYVVKTRITIVSELKKGPYSLEGDERWMIFPSGNLRTGEHYVVLLSLTETPNRLVLVARFGSIIPKNSQEYLQLLEFLD